MRRTSSTALDRMPPGADLATLRVWAEWRRQLMPIDVLARRAGYPRSRVLGLLSGTRAIRDRDRVVADLAEVLGL